jgi:succinyl-CoA synthetase alpha subunit
VQGITGSEGLFHSEQCLEYGTRIMGGVTPGKGGTTVLNKLPVFNTVVDAVNNVGANVSLIFVPPVFAADAILEAIDANISLIVCITEGIPVRDMILVYDVLKKSNTRLIGPNCPGIITPEETKIGIMPGFIFKKGKIGLISKSGTLTYEAAYQIVEQGLGLSTCVGIGGDPIIGSDMKVLLKMFENDPDTEAIVLIGEIGGSMEIVAANYTKKYISKPVIGFVAGDTAPHGKRMGHAGAIISGTNESAKTKKKIMRQCGIDVVDSPANIGIQVQKVLSK